MKKKRTWIWLALIVGAVALTVLIFFAFGLWAKAWYLLPSFEDYYVSIPTDLSQSEAAASTVTITKVTGWNKKTVTAEYWADNKCFHAVLTERGIYAICMETPQQNRQIQYVEIGRDEIYCISLESGAT